MKSMNFNLPDPSSLTIALAFAQLLTEMSIRNLTGDKAQSARKANNLTANCEPIA
jgi:hypothetical protein